MNDEPITGRNLWWTFW